MEKKNLKRKTLYNKDGTDVVGLFVNVLDIKHDKFI